MSIFEEFPHFHGDGEDGDDFAPEVRALCDEEGFAIDSSWHNNGCPSVTFQPQGDLDQPMVILWDKGHTRTPDDGARFSVMLCASDSAPVDLPADFLCETDDVAEAVAAFRSWAWQIVLGGVGHRVRLRCDVERYPHAFVRAGATGILVCNDGDNVGVLLDEHDEGLDEWGNVLWWGPDDVFSGDNPADSVEVLAVVL